MSEKWHEKHISMQSWERLYKFWLGVAFLIMLGFGIRNCYQHEEIVEKLIKENSNLQKLDTICKSVAETGNFEYKSKYVLTKRRNVVNYTYSSSEPQGIFFANNYFRDNGWKVSSRLSTTTSIEFEKDKMYVEITEKSEVLSSSYSYSINCRN
jgi:hypothetical protein